ncbi:MAG: hypothetical protein ACE5JS_19215 [Nitrospinota bacterium]
MNEFQDLEAVEREALWRMSERWLKEGSNYQAMGVYWKLLDRYPESEEAQWATAEALDLARTLEKEGKVWQAISLYGRLAGRGRW